MLLFRCQWDKSVLWAKALTAQAKDPDGNENQPAENRRFIFKQRRKFAALKNARTVR
jgi:hypothetical protein